MTSMIESGPLACATHTSQPQPQPQPQPPACPAARGAGEWSGSAASDERWIFSFSPEGVIPSKMQWLGQEAYATITQQKIDEVLRKVWATAKAKRQMDAAQGHPFHGVAPAPKKSGTALYISLAAMSQTVLGSIAPAGLSLHSALAHHRFDNDLGAFFMAFDKYPLRLPEPRQSAVVQSLTWVLDNIDALKVPEIQGLVIDGLQDADEHNAPIIIGLLDDIELSGLPLFFVQKIPAKLLRIRDLDDLIVKDSRLSFVVSGLMNQRR